MRSMTWMGLALLLVAGEAGAEASDAARNDARYKAEQAALVHVRDGRFQQAAETIEAFMKAFPHGSNQGSSGTPDRLAAAYRARAAVAEKAKANGRAELRALLMVAAFPSSDSLSLSEEASGGEYVLQVLARLRAADPAMEKLLSRKVKVVAGSIDGLTPMETGLVLDGVTSALRELGIAADVGAGDDLFTVAASTSDPEEIGMGGGFLSCSIRVTGRWTSAESLVLSAVDLTVTKPGFSAALARQNAASSVGKVAGRKLLKAVLAAPPMP